MVTSLCVGGGQEKHRQVDVKSNKSFGFLVGWGDVSPLSVLKLATGDWPCIMRHEVRLLLIRIQRIVLLASVDKHSVRPLSRMSHNSDEVERVDVLTKQILQSLRMKRILEDRNSLRKQIHDITVRVLTG
ncbi:hypothetical protein CEXT_191731 [Caerostris extrusa]|uniref:Uncharacterized protein n=1 Tax=Caerostris extrusa TaxID=172846 RepID=A0AAV4NEC6_CAEEX|nr:hypothetical protein CEXT_191731 [Caerostris extrusa]